MLDVSHQDQITALLSHLSDREALIRSQVSKIVHLERRERELKQALASFTERLQRVTDILASERQARDRFDYRVHRPLNKANSLTNQSPDFIGDVRRFHVGFQANDPAVPTIPSPADRDLRWSLIDEEVNKELKPAMDDGDLVGIADAIADSIYVLVGTALKYGIPLDAVWNEVQSSNMSKFGDDGKAIFREDGKVLKGPNFRKPDIASIIEKASSK